MEYQKITKLLGSTPDKVSRFITKNWIEVNDQSGKTYTTGKPIRFKTSMLRSDLFDFSDAYILVKGTITVAAAAGNGNIAIKRNRLLVLKNNAPFISCISKINGEPTENAEDLNVVTPMYNLLEYSKNYRKTTGSLFNYYRDELTDERNDDNNLNKNVIRSESFKYKSGITGANYIVPATVINDDGNQVANPNYDVDKEGTKEIAEIETLKLLCR